jgi:hypothetical protein
MADTNIGSGVVTKRSDYAKVPVYVLWAERLRNCGSIPCRSVAVFSFPGIECRDNTSIQATTVSCKISAPLIFADSTAIPLYNAT